MANDTRSSRKSKDDENDNSKGRHNSGKASTSSGAATPDASGVRRSARETSSKKSMIPSPSSTRKSERLEKRTSTTPPINRKSERVEKQKMPGPLRRSERGKKQSSSSSSGSKKSHKSSGSSDMKRKKEKKEKSVKQLTLETKEVSNSEKPDTRPGQVEKKRLDARAYRALFKRQTRKAKAADHHRELNKMDKICHGHSKSHEDSGPKLVDGVAQCSQKKEEDLGEAYVERACERTLEGYCSKKEEDLVEGNVERACERTLEGSCSSGYKSANEALENNGEAELSHSSLKGSCTKESSGSEDGDGMEVSESGAISTELSDDAEKAQEDCSAKENLQAPELVDSTLDGRILDGDIDLDRVETIMPLNVSVDAASEDIAVTSSPSGCKRKNLFETCVTCFKRQRIDHDSMKQEFCSCNTKLNQEVPGTSIVKDRGELEAGLAECNSYMQQEGSSVDFRTDGDQNTCLICKIGGKLLCCKGRGCKRSYHLSCLDPPLDDVPLGVWYCSVCVRKKIESGAYSVSEGVESIWNVKEVEILDDGLQRQKQFFVKYKGLAHVHNRWVPESELLTEAPSVVKNFNQKYQGVRWRHEWTVPHRLLQKRLLMSSKQRDEYIRGHSGDKLDCHYEWLVKWRGLDYEHATWELENASFLNSPEGQSLIRDYETRRENAKRTHLFRVDKTHERKKGPSVNSSQLSAASSFTLDNNLDFIIKLREYWQKNQNVVVFDDQERILKVISYILSLSHDVCRPFLIISTSTMLDSWDDEFLRLAPSLDVVVYYGNREMRKSIRTLEFYGEGGCLMFQVLITSPEVIIEDLNVFECIGWEAIIVDECQRTSISSHFGQLKILTTDMRILLVSGQLKDSIPEYLNMLSLLDSHGSDGLINDSNDNIGNLKERLSKYIAYGCNSESSKFVEYWVPVELSNVQLEQYCATLISNSLSLRSSLRHDHVGALRDVLISTRKCCDHPYVVDPSLQLLLTKDLKEVEYLDVGIKASGKLHLLDTMLLEIKNRGFKVLILFQSIGGSGRDSIGDILDDFLRQRFGPDSYERVDGGVLLKKKQAALTKFNNESGRFVFLLDIRACFSSIKLSSVDIVIIFDSDWSPVNDLRALQKITLDSQSEQIKVFRLYSSCTVEEKTLILAKHRTLDSQNISRGTSHTLLMWGASYLLNKLDEFHACDTPASSTSSLFDQSLLKDVVQEFLTILSGNSEGNDTRNLSIILKVKQNRGTYSADFPLFGEPKIQVIDEELSHVFWMKLLEGKHPRWKYPSGSSQRNRKRVQHFDDVQKKLEVECEEVVKKRRKVINNNVDSPSVRQGIEDGRVFAGDKEGTPASDMPRSLAVSNTCVNDMIHASQASPSIRLAKIISEVPEVNMVECEDRRKLRDSQKSLHLLLKPEMAKLCEVLQLSEDIKNIIEMFLEYVMTNHHVNREPATILQAFQISLCWTAASLLKHKIGHKESLALAKRHLNFGCKKEEADYVYSMLRCLKKMFLYRTGNFKVAYTQKASELLNKYVSKDHLHATCSQSASNLQKVKAVVEDWSRSRDPECSDEHVLSELVSAPEFQLAKKDFSKSIKDIKKKCNKQMKKLFQKHEEEKEDFERKYEEEKAQLENKKRMEVAVIRRLHGNVSMMGDKLMILDNVYAKKFEELKCQRDIHLKNLEAMQVAAMSKVQEREARWVEGVKSWAQVEFANPPLNEPGHGVECSQTSERVRAHDCRENVIPVTGHFSGLSDKIVHSMQGIGVRSSEIHETDCSVVAGSDPINTVTLPVKPNSENHGLDTVASEGASITGFGECNRAGSSGEDQDNRVSMNICSKQQILVGAVPHGEDRSEVPETVSSSDGSEGILPMTSSCEEQIHDGAMLSMPDGDNPSIVPETVSSTDGMENIVSSNACRSEEQDPVGATATVHDGEVPVPDGATVIVHDGEVPSGVPETVSSCGGPEHFVSVNSSSSEEQIPGGTTSVSDGEVPSGVPEFVHSNNGVENVISVNTPPSGEQIPNGVTLLIPEGVVPVGVPETAAGEVVEGGGTSRENVGACAMVSDNSVGVSQQDRVDCVVEQEINFEELPLVDSNSVQPVTTVSQGGPVPSNQASSDVCSLLCTSAGVQAGDAAASETQSHQVEPPLSHPVDAVSSDQSNHETLVMEAAVQVQLSPPTDSSTRNILPDLPLASRIESQPSNEGYISNQIAQAPMQPEENNIELSSQALLQSVACFAQHPTIDTPIGGLASNVSDTRTVARTSGLGNRAVQTAASAVSQMPSHVSHDPLQNELERIRKETDQTIKIHEETKLQLKSDCDKEIEEVVAQIRRKYETKLQEIETEFLPRKKELDTIHNKVLMNKILAEAFRSKCMSAAPGTQQEVSSTFMQQLVQFQQTAQRPPLVAGTPPSGGPPVTVPQTTVVPAVSLQTVPPSAVSPHTTAPPLQSINHSPSLISGTPTRPPYISSIGSEIRAPAPHLQPFRPSTSMSATSLPSLSRGIPSQQAPGNPPTSSPSLSQLPPRLSPPMYQSGNRAPRPESVGGLSALPNSSLSALELLMDVDKRCGANPNPPSCTPHLPDLGSNMDIFIQPQCGLPSSMHANLPHTSGATDIVCLSDDD